ncbi:Hypothetical_protein [Hexamita inflata]|uniref:Hypothetical_protein n=1 Tax=Hexamita inflata TaxID=28002 RepID=A0AA86V047_9EUKA|nr:Hypothetical protein HINF_LOCUS58667 [Hexamita inflata]
MSQRLNNKNITKGQHFQLQPIQPKQLSYIKPIHSAREKEYFQTDFSSELSESMISNVEFAINFNKQPINGSSCSTSDIKNEKKDKSQLVSYDDIYKIFDLQ